PSIIWILFPLCTNPKAPYFLKIDSGATNSSFLTVTLNLVTQLVTDSIFSFPPKACRYPSGLGKSPVDSLDTLGSFEGRSEEHTSELQSRFDLVCRLLLEKKKQQKRQECHY